MAPKRDFRFPPKTGLKSDIAPCLKSAKSGSAAPKRQRGISPFCIAVNVALA
jgi:hypothetical protein